MHFQITETKTEVFFFFFKKLKPKFKILDRLNIFYLKYKNQTASEGQFLGLRRQ